MAQGVKPVWLYDLDFKNNPQSDAFRLNGQAYSGGFVGAALLADGFQTMPGVWRCGGSRISRSMSAGSNARPDRFASLTFLDNPDYWDRARHSAGLTVVDASYQSAAIALIAPNMDGVILVARCAHR